MLPIWKSVAVGVFTQLEESGAEFLPVDLLVAVGIELSEESVRVRVRHQLLQTAMHHSDESTDRNALTL